MSGAKARRLCRLYERASLPWMRGVAAEAAALAGIAVSALRMAKTILFAHDAQTVLLL